MQKRKLILCTIGEIAGIGPFLLHKVLHDFIHEPDAAHSIAVDIVIFGPRDYLQSIGELYQTPLKMTPINTIDDLYAKDNARNNAAISNTLNNKKISIYIKDIEIKNKVVLGHIDPQNSHASLQSLMEARAWAKKAVDDRVLGDGKSPFESVGIWTMPIHKQALLELNAGFEYPGQTEFFGDTRIFDGADPVMMLCNTDFAVVPLTTHIPLKDVAGHLSKDMVARKLMVVARSLMRYRNAHHADQPLKMAMLGLNPHAGEGGKFGTEEMEILEPAINAFRAELGTELGAGQQCVIDGPMAADTAFLPSRRDDYDVFIACYHDQALVPVKMHDFERTINVTLGLPNMLRTSPDHGPALDLAADYRDRPAALLDVDSPLSFQSAHEALMYLL